MVMIFHWRKLPKISSNISSDLLTSLDNPQAHSPIEEGALIVPIRPEVAMYGVLRNLNYKPWYALAEFVDNAIQSWLQHEMALKSNRGQGYRLEIKIVLDKENNRIIIRDNAAGIAVEDFPRAFKPAQLPADRSGLSEFGMGMKSAACWFCDSWTVRTCALGQGYVRTIIFDIPEIIASNTEKLTVLSDKVTPNEHFTEIVLNKVHQFPVTKTISKIKEHLSSIYRDFIRSGKMSLQFSGEVLSFEEPKILLAPDFRNTLSTPILWKKKIDFALSDGKKITGFVAIRERGSTSHAGFSLFRRRRLIIGSADDPYRPIEIFGKNNSFLSQRLFGEINLDDVSVSHTKDGFQWGIFEEEFLDRLKLEINKAPLRLLDQASEYRVNPPREKIILSATAATERTAAVVEAHAPPVVEKQSTAVVLEPVLEVPKVLTPVEALTSSRKIRLVLNKQEWNITIETIFDHAVGDWISYSKREIAPFDGRSRSIDIRVNLAHPFVTKFIGAQQENVEIFIRIAVGFALSLISAQDIGMGRGNPVILGNFNELLRDVLSKDINGTD